MQESLFDYSAKLYNEAEFQNRNGDKMNEFNSVSVIIPSYDPDEKLIPTINGLLKEGFSDIIVIDDGSHPENKKFFPESGGGVTVLRHDVNRGKGAGLKTAFKYILENRPDIAGCVTADGDGQHQPKDIANCVRDMLANPNSIVLGARDFSLPGVPDRSKKGNRITCGVFRVLFGMNLSDTQTGLRVFPRSVIPDMLEVRGDRYEYETNMLLAIKRIGIPFREVKIDTVYINDNETSHFRPVRDSIRIYGLICAFFLSSVISAIIDVGLFTLFNILFAATGIKYAYAFAVGCARIISSAVNYTVNRRVVFGRGTRGSVFRYYILAAAVLFVSAGCGQLAANLIPFKAAWLQTIIKAAIDGVMFVLSFRVQHEWVFGNKKK